MPWKSKLQLAGLSMILGGTLATLVAASERAEPEAPAMRALPMIAQADPGGAVEWPIDPAPHAPDGAAGHPVVGWLGAATTLIGSIAMVLSAVLKHRESRWAHEERMANLEAEARARDAERRAGEAERRAERAEREAESLRRERDDLLRAAGPRDAGESPTDGGPPGEDQT